MILIMVKINIDDFNFVYNLLEKQDKDKLKKHSKADGDSTFIEDDMADDLYDLIIDLTTLHGFNKEYEINETGKRLEDIGDLIYDQIEAC